MKTKFSRRTDSLTIIVMLLIPVLLVYATGCEPADPVDEEQTFVFHDVSVIDAVDGLRTGQSVVVTGDRIVAAGPAEEIDESAGAILVDGSGKYLLPGLWDAHVHLTNTPAMQPALFPLLIANGITYVRDTAATLDAIRPILEQAGDAAREGMAPDVYFIGPHIDGPQLSWASSVSAVTVEQGRAFVDSLIREGVDEIKTYELIDPGVFSEVVSRARGEGFNVTAHVPLAMDVVEASNAGLTAMEHMKNLEFSCSSDWQALLEERRQMIEAGADKEGNELRWGIQREQRIQAIRTQDEERCRTVLATLARNRTWQVPTLTYTAEADHRLYAGEEWRDTFRYLPEPVRSDWQERARDQAGESPAEAQLARAGWAYDMVPRLAEAGIGLMAGTDMPLFLLTPGFSLHQELALLVRAGLTPLQAIEAATLGPAQYYGLDDSQGAIAEEMKADLLILDANPLEDITNTQRIHAVMRNGRLHTRQDLDGMLEQLEEHGRVY